MTKCYHAKTDPNGAGIAYTNSQKPTANVSLTYDPIYGCLSQMTDGTGSTGYTYHPVDGSTFGAGNLHTIDGPLTINGQPTDPNGRDSRLLEVTPGSPVLTDKSIVHTYDGQARRVTRSIREWTVGGWWMGSLDGVIAHGLTRFRFHGV